MLCVLALLYFNAFSSFGFLLDQTPQSNGNSSNQGQFITVSTFIDEKNRLKQESDRIRQDAAEFRRDVNENMALLTSQIKVKFNDFDRKIEVCEQMNETLTDTLIKYASLEQTFINLQRMYAQVTKNYTLLRENLAAFQNRSVKIENEISEFKKLEAIKPLTEIKVLNKTVQALKTQTDALALQEYARRYDFLALLNMTVDTKNSLQEQIDETSEQVAITAYHSAGGVMQRGNAVIFDDVKLHLGVRDVSSFRNNGKFICEKSGLYIITSSIMSTTFDAEFFILVNGQEVAHADIGEHADNYWHTATTVVAQYLNVNDTVCVQIEGAITVFSHHSCYFSIVKVK